MPLTFVPDQIVSKEDEQNEQQEDNESHNPSDDGMIGTGGRGHRTGVCREKRHIVRTGMGRTFSSHADLALDNITEETSTSGESRCMQAQGTCLSLCSGEYHHTGNVVILKRKKCDYLSGNTQTSSHSTIQIAFLASKLDLNQRSLL